MAQRLRMLIGAVLVMVPLVLPAAASAGENPDDRARVSFVTGTLDDSGELWLKVIFYVPWDPKPPADLFSFFFELVVMSSGETAITGWEVHDGQPLFLGPPGGEAFILDNGCVIVSTGLFPTGDFTVDVSASFGSWAEGAENPIFGSETMGTSAEVVESGDPFTVFGGQPVFDLTSQEMIMDSPTTTAAPATTAGPGESTTTSTTAAPASTTTTTAPPPTTTTVPSPEVTAHQLTGGKVVISASPGVVNLVSWTPKPGFSGEVEKSGPDEVRVRFESDNHESEFEAEWDDGRLVISKDENPDD